MNNRTEELAKHLGALLRVVFKPDELGIAVLLVKDATGFTVLSTVSDASEDAWIIRMCNEAILRTVSQTPIEQSRVNVGTAK